MKKTKQVRKAPKAKRKTKPKRQAKAATPAPVELDRRGRPLSSIRSYCEEHGHDRDTVSRKLTEMGISPAGTERGNSVYRESDLHLVACSGHDGAPRDPHRRKSYFAAELDRIKLEKTCGELVPRVEVEEEYARLVKIMVQFLESLPDKMERDCGLGAAVVSKLEIWLDEARQDLYRAALNDDGNAPAV